MSRSTAIVAAWLLTVTIVTTVFVRGFLHPWSQEPFDHGPVVVLGGSAARVETGAQLLPDPSDDRPLVLSHGAITHFERAGGSCEATGVRCIRPEPASTWGEAQAVAVLARQEGWRSVTVVTDGFHTGRSRSLMRRCLDVPVRVVSTAGRGVPVRLAVREAMATAVSAVAYRDC